MVTGANCGIGLAICQQLAERGVTVLLGARNEHAAASAILELRTGGLDVRFIAIDTDAPETFAADHDAISREFGKLDILVNNIGIGEDRSYTAETSPCTCCAKRSKSNS